MWQVLTANLAVVALFVSGWNHAQPWLRGHSQTLRNAVFAAVMGAGTVASMMLAVEVQKGVIFDLRSSLIAVAGLFGGPLAAAVAAGMAAACRALIGGQGMVAGLLGIAVAAAIGASGHLLLRERDVRSVHLLALAAAVSTGTIVVLLTMSSLQGAALRQLGMTVSLLNFLATAVAGLAILHMRQLAAEREILHAALLQAPDYQYVKDRQGRFVAVNGRVAAHNGFPAPAEMRGKTDWDIAPPERAHRLFEAEQRLLNSGEALVDEEEAVTAAGEALRWFLTSKVPLRNGDGQVIGLAGVSRDITERKELEAELTASRNQLSYALAEMSDGLAMFDAEGRLAYCNRQYQECFPLTKAVRVPGANLTDILKAVAETGEQTNIPPGESEEWVRRTAGELHVENEQEIQLFDMRWIRVRTRPTREGMCLVLTSDITRQKEAEKVLAAFAENLKRLAATDGLTGLPNRRAFDGGLDNALWRSEEKSEPVALILIDVDHFKAFNDRYGHPAGDKCLSAVGKCLERTARADDLAARYGGEEFALVLAGADEEAAEAVAQRFRAALHRLAVPHDGNSRKIVTASMGVAAFPAGATVRRADDLLRRADAALYEAKSAGRDAVVRWSALPAASARSTGAA